MLCRAAPRWKSASPQLLHIDTISAPDRAGDRLFYMKRKANEEKSVLYWRSATDPNVAGACPDRSQSIHRDEQRIAGRHGLRTLDGKLLAYTLRPNNADEATLYVKDVESGNDLPGEVIEGAKYADPVVDARWLRIRLHLPAARPIRPIPRTGPALPRCAITSSAPIRSKTR